MEIIVFFLNVLIKSFFLNNFFPLETNLKEHQHFNSFVAFHLKMSTEAATTQQHRAEVDFDINGIKEKIEILDQGKHTCQLQEKRNNLLSYLYLII